MSSCLLLKDDPKESPYRRALDLYPVLIIQLVEINYPDIQVFHEGGLFLLPPLILATSFFMVVLPSLSKLYR